MARKQRRDEAQKTARDQIADLQQQLAATKDAAENWQKLVERKQRFHEDERRILQDRANDLKTAFDELRDSLIRLGRRQAEEGQNDQARLADGWQNFIAAQSHSQSLQRPFLQHFYFIAERR